MRFLEFVLVAKHFIVKGHTKGILGHFGVCSLERCHAYSKELASCKANEHLPTKDERARKKGSK